MYHSLGQILDCAYAVYMREQVTTTLIYRNINSSLLHQKSKFLLEREREICYDWYHAANRDRYIQSLVSLCFFHEKLIQGLFLNLFLSAQNGVICLFYWLLTLTDPWDWKLLSLYIFWHQHILSSGTIHIAFPSSLVYLKTQVHILFMKSALTRCQRSIWNTNTIW